MVRKRLDPDREQESLHQSSSASLDQPRVQERSPERLNERRQRSQVIAQFLALVA